MHAQGAIKSRLQLSQVLKQSQKLVMLPQMQQALHFLQVPLLEISTLISEEMNQNPLLEYDEEQADEEQEQEQNKEEEQKKEEEQELQFNEEDYTNIDQLEEDFYPYRDEGGGKSSAEGKEQSDKHQAFIENCLMAQPTLFEQLYGQARALFGHGKQLEQAEQIIGSIDDRGYLKSSLSEIALWSGFAEKELEETLKVIQTFEPFGVGSRSLQELLLLQLERADQKGSLAYRMIDEQFEALLHNQIPLLSKRLKAPIEQIYEAIEKQICSLQLHPGPLSNHYLDQTITPDVIIEIENDNLAVRVNNDFIPSLRLNRKYLKLLHDEDSTKETIDFIKQKISSARWLLRNIDQRNDTLEKLMLFLVNKQREFFLKRGGNLEPLTMREAAEAIQVHESTVARAVMNKYASTPRGTFSLRYFFTRALQTPAGKEVGSGSVKQTLVTIVENEDKANPYSDEQLVEMLKEKKMICARRTVAKYRKELKIGNTRQRKRY